MEIGLSNNIYDNPFNVIDNIREIAKTYKVIEIEIAEEAQKRIFNCSKEEYKNLIEELLKIKDQLGLHYHVHAAWFGKNTDVLHPDKNEANESLELLEKGIQFANDINSNFVTFHPGNSHGRPNKVLRELLLERVSPLSEKWSKWGIILCLEIMGAQRPKHAVMSPEDYVYIAERSKIRVCIDIPHLASLNPETDEILKNVELLAKHTCQVHIADTTLPHHRHIPIGKGNVPILDILLKLDDCGYQYDAIVEEFNVGHEVTDYLNGAIELVKTYKARKS